MQESTELLGPASEWLQPIVQVQQLADQHAGEQTHLQHTQEAYSGTETFGMDISLAGLLVVSLITTAITTNKIIAAVVVLIVIVAVVVWYGRRSRPS